MTTAEEQKINMQIVRAIHAMGDEYFEECQKRVPVESLRDIGVLEKFGNSLDDLGWTVAYETPMANDIHEGVEGQPGFEWVSTVKAHMRTTASGKRVRVSRHRKRYVGYKPTHVPSIEGKPYAYVGDRGSMSDGGIWYSKNMSRNVPARPWMDEAWTYIRDIEPAWLREVLPLKITQTERTSIRRL